MEEEKKNEKFDYLTNRKKIVYVLIFLFNFYNVQFF